MHAGRFLLGEVEPIAQDLALRLKQAGRFEQLEVGGSYRRRQETLGDLDLLATSRQPKKAMDFFFRLPGAIKVLQRGVKKSEILLRNGIKVDLRLVTPASWGAALQYFTGDKAHNIKLRKIAAASGLKLSEYGLFRGSKMIAGKTEAEVYKKLGLDWIPPELRTDTGEIEAAGTGALPKLLNYGEVAGDLQVQTDWSDGRNSIWEMARAARSLGRQYIAITDHTQSLTVANGLTEQRLLRQIKEIDRLNRRLFNFKILKGAEVDILKDGRLDIEDRVLAALDVVGISVHSYLKMSRLDMTKRLLRAVANPYVHILFHPTARLLQKRKAIDFDFPQILKAVKTHRVALEIDAHPQRLDLHDVLIRQAVNAGVKLCINSDAHSVRDLAFIHFGEAQARRGWAAKTDILNTRPLPRFLESVKK